MAEFAPERYHPRRMTQNRDKFVKEARRAIRYRHDSALELIDDADDKPTEFVRLVDVSSGGMSFSSARPFAKGARIRARLRLLDAGVLVITGTVIRIKEKSNSAVYAVEFDSVRGKRS
jgi:hypothetical protein